MWGAGSRGWTYSIFLMYSDCQSFALNGGVTRFSLQRVPLTSQDQFPSSCPCSTWGQWRCRSDKTSVWARIQSPGCANQWTGRLVCLFQMWWHPCAHSQQSLGGISKRLFKASSQYHSRFFSSNPRNGSISSVMENAYAAWLTRPNQERKPVMSVGTEKLRMVSTMELDGRIPLGVMVYPPKLTMSQANLNF